MRKLRPLTRIVTPSLEKRPEGLFHPLTISTRPKGRTPSRSRARLLLALKSVRSLLVALALLVALVAAAWLLFDPFYETNDDVSMRLIVEGHFVPGQGPSEFALFMNALVGKALAAAYTVWPGPPWYDLCLLAVTLAAALSLLYACVDPLPPLGWVFVVGFSVQMLLPILVSCQFTHAAITSAGGGVILLARLALRDLSPRERRLHLALGSVLIVAGSLVRMEAAALAVCLGLVLGLPLLWSRWRDGQPGRTSLIAAGRGVLAAAVVATGLFALDLSFYSRAPGWGVFREHNTLLRIIEYVPQRNVTAPVLSELRRDVGWSKTDLLMLRHWFTTDPELFSIDRVRRAVRVLSPHGPTGASVDLESLRWSVAAFLKEARWPLLFLAVVPWLRPSRRLFAYALYAVLVVVVLVTVLSASLKTVPHRVYWGLLVLSAAFLVLAAARWGGRTRKVPWTIGACFLLALLGLGARQLLAICRGTNHLSITVQRELTELRTTRGQVVVVAVGSAFPYTAHWRPLRQPEQTLAMLPIMSSARTPLVQDYLRRTGREDLPLALCRDPDLWLVAWPRFFPVLADFLREHHGTRVEFRLKHRGTFLLYRCRTAGSNLEP